MVIDVGKNNNQTGEDLNIHLYRHLHDKCILKYPWCRYKWSDSTSAPVTKMYAFPPSCI